MIYKRTSKAEIMLRNEETNLPFNIRNLLNFIDGQATIVELQGLLETQNVGALLKSLKTLGLVEEVIISNILDSKDHDSIAYLFNENKSSDLDKYRSFKPDNTSIDSKFTASQNKKSQFSDAKVALKANNLAFEQALPIAMDLLRTSADPNAFELMFALEKLSSPSQLKALLPSIIRVVSNNPNAQVSVKKILSMIE